jgi:hypothetical protein
VSDTNLGIRLFGTGNDGSTLTNYQGGLASWNGIGFRCLTDGVTRFLHETRTGHTTIAGNLVCPTTQVMNSNITWTSNALTTTNTNVTSVTNTANWSSNVLFQKTGGTISGDVFVNGVIGTSNYVSCDDVLATGNVIAQGSVSCKAAVGNGTFPLGTELPYMADGRNYLVGDTAIALGTNAVCTVGDTYANMYDGTARLYVKGNANLTADLYASTLFARDGLVCGATQTTEKIKLLHPFVVEVGSSSTQKRTRNGLDIGTTLSDTNYYGIVSFANTSGDVFVGSIDNLTTTTCTLHTFRVDGSSWATNLVAHVLLWKY